MAADPRVSETRPQAALEHLTAVQRRRRQRMLDAAAALAVGGGFEAVQMREVALRADVALGTLYRYFASKEHLLITALADHVSGLRSRLALRPAHGDDDAARVMDVIRRATRGLQREPNLIAAMLKSLISSGPGVDETIGPIGVQMMEMVVGAMRPEGTQRTERDYVAAEVIQQVWLASLLWWVAGRSPAREVEEKVERAVVLLLRR